MTTTWTYWTAPIGGYTRRITVVTVDGVSTETAGELEPVSGR